MQEMHLLVDRTNRVKVHLLKGARLFGRGCPVFSGTLGKEKEKKKKQTCQVTASNLYRKTHKRTKPKENQKAKFTSG